MSAGNPGDARFVQRLGHQRHLPDALAGDGVVQRARAADAEPVEPVARLLEHRRTASGTASGARRSPGWRWWGNCSMNPGGNACRREVLQAARRRHHVALEVVAPPVQPVQRQRIRVPGARAGAPCRSLRVTRRRRSPRPRDTCSRDDWRVLGDDVAHAPLDGLQFVRGERRAPAHFAVVAGGRRRRVLDADLAPREHLVEGHEHQERQRAAIDADAVRRRRVQRRDGGVVAERRRSARAGARRRWPP